jgi:hypothetical protein
MAHYTKYIPDHFICEPSSTLNAMFVYCACAFAELPDVDRWQLHADNKECYKFHVLSPLLHEVVYIFIGSQIK